MSDLRKDVWIEVAEDCPMSHEIEVNGDIHILLGSTSDSADLVFTPAALVRLGELVATILARRAVERDRAADAEGTPP